MLTNNLVALGLTLAIAFAWLRLNDFFAHKGWVTSTLSRKIIHIGTGPIFVLCWLLFNPAQIAPCLAALVPLGITIQFALVGFGIIQDPSAVEAMSRTGDRQEILRGPLYYGIAFVILTILFWRNTPIGIVSLMILCGGDGLADILGKGIKSPRLAWSPGKTLAGSLTMFLGGFMFAVLLIWIYNSQGYFILSMSQTILRIGIIALGATIVESLPFKDIDNITVPLASVLLGMLLF